VAGPHGADPKRAFLLAACGGGLLLVTGLPVGFLVTLALLGAGSSIPILLAAGMLLCRPPERLAWAFATLFFSAIGILGSSRWLLGGGLALAGGVMSIRARRPAT